MKRKIDTVELLGGHPALDFVNTVHDWRVAEPRDYLQEFEDLLRWHRRVELLKPAALAAFDACPEDQRQAALAAARELRRNIHALMASRIAGEAAPEALAALNRVLRETAAYRRLEAGPDGETHFGWDFRGAPARAILGPVAWQAAQLLDAGPTERIKECPAELCGWLFLDLSRNRSRTWCSMKTCGNNAKVKRFRSRHG